MNTQELGDYEWELPFTPDEVVLLFLLARTNHKNSEFLANKNVTVLDLWDRACETGMPPMRVPGKKQGKKRHILLRWTKTVLLTWNKALWAELFSFLGQEKKRMDANDEPWGKQNHFYSLSFPWSSLMIFQQRMRLNAEIRTEQRELFCLVAAGVVRLFLDDKSAHIRWNEGHAPLMSSLTQLTHVGLHSVDDTNEFLSWLYVWCKTFHERK